MFRDLFKRLHTARLWVLVHFFGLPLLLLIGIGWTRLGEKHLWQVTLSLLLPLLILAALFALQTATLRRMLAPLAASHTSFLQAALMLLPVLVLALIAWHSLDNCDEKIINWASFLNSKASIAWRARLFSFEHLTLWMNRIEWLLRWVGIPWLLIPFATDSAEHGWRLRWRVALRMLLDWRWLVAVLLVAIVGVALPAHFFKADPHGTLSAQVWAVSAKLIAAYLCSVVSWLLLLAWSAVLLRRKESITNHETAKAPLM